MITIKTEHEFCTGEPDFDIHEDNPNLLMNCSAGEDNHSDENLIEEIISRVSSDRVNCLDLGCAGGQLILDLNNHEKTDICVGLDGSAGVYKQNNWSIDSNKNVLKHANLTKTFSVLNNNEPVKFDIITCWEVIEHFEEKDLDVFFSNVTQHLSENGLFFGSIALFPDTRDSNGFHQKHPSYNKNDPKQYQLHKTVFDSKDPWDKILSKHFKVLDYDFKVKLRNHHNSYYFMCKQK